MSLAETSLRRPVTTLMFYIGVVFLGVIAFRSLSVDFLPPIRIPRLTVQTPYVNTSPEEVEYGVTQQIESALGTVSGVKRLSSVSREGTSVVSVEFYWGTNMDFALIEVREKLDQARSTLPRDAGRPTILTIDPSSEPIITLGIAARKKSDSTPADAAVDLVSLKETAQAFVKRRVEQVEGVAQASVLGGVDREVRVCVDMGKLLSLGLTLGGVSNALAAANLTLPGGTLKQGLLRYSLRTVGEFTHPDEIRNAVIGATPGGKLVTVADIATVVDTVKERQGLTRYNGREIVALQIRKDGGANTVAVSRAVHAVIDQLQSEYPDMEIVPLSDQAEFIGKSIDDVEQAIVIGSLLAFLVLFFFLRRPKYPMVIGLTMPVSILATLIAMYFLKINLNVISLSGLAIGIGMLGDNAIVVVENVARLREYGIGLAQATLEGAKEISTAVTASTLTNVAIFLPVVFVEGVASQLFLDMGMTMTISLLVSLVVAVTLVPTLVSREPAASASIRWFSRMAGPWVVRVTVLLSARFYDLVDRTTDATTNGVDQYLAWGVLHRTSVVWGTIAIFALSILAAAFVTSESAPDIDQRRFIFQVLMPKGTSLEGISSIAADLDREIRSISAVEGVYSTVGITDESNCWSVNDASLERATFEIKVREGALTARVMDIVRGVAAQYQRSMHGVEFAVKSRNTTFERILRSQTSDIRVRIQGTHLATATLLARRFAETAAHTSGLVDLRTSLQEGAPGYRIEVDRDAVSYLGLSVQTVAQRITQQIRGSEATSLFDFDRKIPIRVVPSAADQQTIDQVLDSQILVDGTPIPLRTLVRVETTPGSREIWRENQQRAVVFLGNVSGRSLSSVVDELQVRAKSINPPPGYTITIGGENEEMDESFRSLFLITALSLLIVYMILAAEYESILYPLVIILTSPLAFIGAICAMVITGQHYNVMSLIGVVIMIGAVDNDAVIAVDIITALRRQGMPLSEAIRTGIQRRLRPILMTTATTVLGVVPLLFEFGAGSELVRALAIPIAGGLIASTLFTVVFIPIAYTYVDEWAMKGRSA